MMPAVGDVLSVTKAASVQFGFRPILFRVIRVMEAETRNTYPGWVWLDGYAIDNVSGDAVERRQIFVQLAGLRPARAGSVVQAAKQKNSRGH